MKLIILSLMLSSCALFKVAEQEAELIIEEEAQAIRERQKERRERKLKKKGAKKKEAVSG